MIMHQSSSNSSSNDQINHKVLRLETPTSINRQSVCQNMHQQCLQFSQKRNFSTYEHQKDYSRIPLAFRTYFFDQQTILFEESTHLEFKSYIYPFSDPSYETLKKTICGFCNAEGGHLYLGIKEITSTKSKYVLGNTITENGKEEMMKTLRKITQSIYPTIPHSNGLKVQFIPIRETPLKNIPSKLQREKYLYDFSTDDSFNPKSYPFLKGQYVVRIVVPMGNQNCLYSYEQTNFKLNPKSTSNEFVAIRVNNEVLVKELSIELIEKYIQRLEYKKDCIDEIWREKKRSVLRYAQPEIGNPSYSTQKVQKRSQEKVEQKRKDQTVVGNEKNIQKKADSGLLQSQSKNQLKLQINKKSISKQKLTEQRQRQELTKKQKQEKIQKIFEIPLNFMVVNASEQRIKKVIAKTPAKNYATVSSIESKIDKKQITIVKVSNYAYMEEFQRVIQKIEQHFKATSLKFIGVSKKMKVKGPTKTDIKIICEMLEEHRVKHINRDDYVEFYTFHEAVMYFRYFMHFKFSIEAIAE